MYGFHSVIALRSFHFCPQFYSRIKWTMNDTNFLLDRHGTTMSSHFQWIHYDSSIFLCRLLSFSVHVFFSTCSIYRILLWMMRRWLTGHCMKNIYRLSAFHFDYFERIDYFLCHLYEYWIRIISIYIGIYTCNRIVVVIFRANVQLFIGWTQKIFGTCSLKWMKNAK